LGENKSRERKEGRKRQKFTWCKKLVESQSITFAGLWRQIKADSGKVTAFHRYQANSTDLAGLEIAKFTNILQQSLDSQLLMAVIRSGRKTLVAL